MKLEKKPSLELVRGVGREGISSRGETVRGGARADGGRVALRARRVDVERAGGINSGRGGSDCCRRRCDGGRWGGVERVVVR